MEMEALDQAALELALEQLRKEPGRPEQLDWKIEHDGWQDTAEFAAYCRQSRTLHLRPWETPPCWVIDPDSPPDFGEGESAGRNYDGRAQAAKLLRKMLALGISRWHPDPRAAIAEARRAPKRAKAATA
jgi:hypothetical protein